MPLHLAAAIGHLDAIRILVQRGADVNARGYDAWTPLQYAAGAGHMDVVRFLLESGADPSVLDVRGETPADHAREEGHYEIVDLIEQWDKIREKAARPRALAQSADASAMPAQTTEKTVTSLLVVAGDGVKEERQLIWVEVLKKCEKCGVPVEPSAKYCWNCGNEVI